MTLLRHICEVCGVDEVLTPEDAFSAGWDYPPNLGAFGVVSPRTCPNCLIDKTVWWAITINKKTSLDAGQLEVVKRIQGEPATIMVVE